MTQPTDRNLLLGLLALQLDFIHRDQLLDALQNWMLDKSQPLNRILVRQGALDAGAEPLLLAVLEKHLQLHEDDVEKSLASLSTLGSLRDDLAALDDPSVNATVAVATCDGDEAPPPRPPRPQERFRILRPHARGGLGEVAIAMDDELNREVALKLIQERYADDRNNRERFVAEAEITGALEHPGIVPVYGLGTHLDGRPFYAMRFIRGDSLHDAARRFHANTQADPAARQLALRKLLGRFIDVCQAIEYAHSRGVLHRDLKPGNIMLGRYGETLVVDWGLAKAVGRHEGTSTSEEGALLPTSGGTATQMGSAIGTPAYMSPEQAAGRIDDMGPASDVYGLGATLFFLLTGEPPVAGDQVATILKKVKSGEVRAPRDVSPATPRPLDAICRKAMALAAGDRYESPQALADDVERWLADEPVLAHREGWVQRTQRWVKKHQTWVAAGMLVALVTGVAGLGVAWQAEEARRRVASEKEAADEARRIAERNFGYALDSVELMLTRVAQERLANLPFMSNVRRQLLEDAVAFYQSALSEQEQALPSVQMQTARSHGLLSRCYVLLGEYPSGREQLDQQAALLAKLDAVPELAGQVRRQRTKMLIASSHLFHQVGRSLEAEAEAAKALALLQESPEAFRETPEAQALRGEALQKSATSLYELGRFTETASRYQEAEETFQRLLEQDPDNDQWLYSLQAAMHNRSSICYLEQDYQTAEQLLLGAIEHQERLLEIAGELPSYRYDHANSITRLASVLRARGRILEAQQRMLASGEMFRELSRDYPGVRHYQRQAAAAAHNLGETYLFMNQLPLAIANFQRSVDALEQLREASPLNPSELGDLANSRMMLGIAQLQSGDAESAEDTMRRSLELWGELCDEFPETPQYRSQAAAVAHNLADILVQLGQTKEAEQKYRESIDRLNALEAEPSRTLQNRADRANSWLRLANLLQATNRAQEAEEAYRQASADLQPLVEAQPENPRHVAQWAASLHNRGNLLLEEGRHSEALQEFERSIDLLEEAAERFPQTPNIRRDLANSLQQQAVALWSLERRPEAQQAMDASIARWEEVNRQSPNTPDVECGLAAARMRNAMWRGDLREAGEMAALAAVHAPPDVATRLGCVLLLAANSLAPYQNQQDQATAENWTKLARDQFRRAIEAGMPPTREMLEDPDLAPLREDPEFRRVLDASPNNAPEQPAAETAPDRS